MRLNGDEPYLVSRPSARQAASELADDFQPLRTIKRRVGAATSASVLKSAGALAHQLLEMILVSMQLGDVAQRVDAAPISLLEPSLRGGLMQVVPHDCYCVGRPLSQNALERPARLDQVGALRIVRVGWKDREHVSTEDVAALLYRHSQKRLVHPDDGQIAVQQQIRIGRFVKDTSKSMAPRADQTAMSVLLASLLPIEATDFGGAPSTAAGAKLASLYHSRDAEPCASHRKGIRKLSEWNAH